MVDPAVQAFAGRQQATAFLSTVAFIEANGYSLMMPNSETTVQCVRDFADHGFDEKPLAERLRD